MTAQSDPVIGAARQDIAGRASQSAMTIGAFADAEHMGFETFARSLSHDLRSPIGVITGFGKALEQELGTAAPERALHYLHRIQSAGQQLEDTIEALMSLAHVTQAPVLAHDVDLTSLATGILGDLKSLDPCRQINAHVQEDLRARGDSRLLRMALENLLGNAWKFTSRRKLSEICFCKRPVAQNDHAYVVRDNGEGFDSAYAAKLFMPFGRLHSQTEFAGTGIGLANVHRIIARHGGRIWAEAKQGCGATFYFTLAA